MNFNGTYLKSFGHCKVLSWKNSVYTDFDRKEIVHNGRILAAVEVPTVRKIEAAILVRGNSSGDVRHKLERIAAWLYGSGTAKLCHETDLTRYFMARCTQVSTPEYYGHSARCTVTFTCSDHRLYASYDDQPVTSEENDMSNFTFAGKHCLNDMGCLFVKDTEPAVPAVKPHVYEISGMNGTLRYNTGRPVLKETALSGTLYFVKGSLDGRMTEAEIARQRHEVAAWLINAERASLVMDNDITRVYQAEVVDETLLNRKDWQNGYLKVKFVVQPVCESVDATAMEASIDLVANQPCSIDLSALTPNGIGYETPLAVSITHKAGADITDLVIGYNAGGVERCFHLSHDDFALSQSETLTITSDGSIRVGDEEGIPYIAAGDFPLISVGGDNYLKITANASATISLLVQCNVRWI